MIHCAESGKVTHTKSYEIDPYGSNESALKSDSAESYDYSGGEIGTLQDEHVQATS
jgi:hypothetical protein